MFKIYGSSLPVFMEISLAGMTSSRLWRSHAAQTKLVQVHNVAWLNCIINIC